jgi:hypothetical protein
LCNKAKVGYEYQLPDLIFKTEKMLVDDMFVDEKFMDKMSFGIMKCQL